MDADEQQICTYLESCPGQMISGIEIARRAAGKWRYRDNPNWAVQPLLRLVERSAVETDSNIYYRLKPIGKTDSQQSPPVNVLRPVTPHWSVSTKAASPATRTSKKILFVDDDKNWRDIVTTTLQDAGYEALTAKDATEAMRVAEGVQLGLTILDLDLAGENGLMLMKFFQRNQSDVPIIFYTGLNHDEDAIKGMLQQGAHQYVRKGPLADLRKAVQAAVR